MATASSNELNRHLKTFLYLSKQHSFDVVCKSALYLIKNLPSSRHAILEYFNTIFGLATVFHANNPNTSNKAQEDVNNLYELIDEIQQVLINLAKTEAWSYELNDWATQLLCTLTNQSESLVIKAYQQQQQQQQQQPPQQLSTIDLLHIWLQCKPIRILLEISQACILECKCKDEIIDKLIKLFYETNNTSFDWIICHLGSLCSKETICKILIIGFNEFLNQQQQQQHSSKSVMAIQQQKFNSIINVLNYFTNFHSQHIQFMLMNILQNYIKGDFEYFKQHYSITMDQAKQYTILYLIKLALSSSNLLYIMSYDLKVNLNRSVLETIYFGSKQMFNAEFKQNLLVNFKLLFKQLTNNTYEFVNYLINISIDCKYDDDELKKSIQYFMQSFLDDLNLFTFTNTKESLPIIESLKKDYKFLLNDLLSNETINQFKQKCLLNLIILIGIQGPSYITNSIMSRLLVTRHYDINNLIKYRQEIENFDINCTKNTIESIIKIFCLNKNFYKNEQIYVNDQITIDLTLNENSLNQFITNLIELHEWDFKNEHCSYNIETMLQNRDHFTRLMSLLDVEFSSIIKLYNKIGLPDRLSVENCLHYAASLVRYFYKLIESDHEINQKLDEIDNLKQLIQISCLKYNDILRNIFLRSFVDYLFDETKFYQFSCKRALVSIQDTKRIDEDYENVSLYEQNLALNKDLPLTKLRAKVPLVENFNRNRSIDANKQEQLVLLNYQFMEIIDIICSSNSIQKANKMINLTPSYNNELLNNLAQLTIERFMSNYVDYQWPEIENLKLYVERDVKVQNLVDESPICWMLLFFIANNQVSLCKCSPIIRSLLAGLILKWENMKEQPSKNNAKMLEHTIKCLDLINKAELLPIPLCYIGDIIPFLNSFEAHVLLTIVWKYLKNLLQTQTNSHKAITIVHKTQDKAMYEQLKLIFQRNINKLAHLYAKFFKDLITNNSQPTTTIPSSSSSVTGTATSTDEEIPLVIVS